VAAGGEIVDALAQGNGMLAHNKPPITAGRPRIWLELPQPDTGLLCCSKRSENKGSPEVGAVSLKGSEVLTSDLFLLSLAQVCRIEPFFPRPL